MGGRDEILSRVTEPWDVIVVGGGITGAGVLREAARAGLRCLLLEQRDFGWGTSSRSGKLVHGGLRYLKQGQVKTTWHSVREREKLLRLYRGLVEPLEFLLPTCKGAKPGPLSLRLGLAVYDLMAGRKSCRYCDAAGALDKVPHLDTRVMTGAFTYLDAATDDARLVLRVLREGRRLGGVTLNYARVEEPLTGRAGRVRALAVRDMLAGRTLEVPGKVVINATGVWADGLRGYLGAKPRMRRLRGSHLVFNRERFPLNLAVSFLHPRDGRPVYAFPWEGTTLLGTTDVDHTPSLDMEPRISPGEGEYLLEGVRWLFPALELDTGDVISTFAGVRPVVNTGKKDPSSESRDHVIWSDRGMVTVTGGKLTTFDLIARQALKEARRWLDGAPAAGPGRAGKPAGETLDDGFDDHHKQVTGWRAGPGRDQLRRLSGRYGPDAAAILEEAGQCGYDAVPGTSVLWAELRWAARCEAVVHLDDLLLRRTRLGHVLPEGGAGLAGRLREKLLPALGWDRQRWEDEWRRYSRLWRQAYSPALLGGQGSG